MVDTEQSELDQSNTHESEQHLARNQPNDDDDALLDMPPEDEEKHDRMANNDVRAQLNSSTSEINPTNYNNAPANPIDHNSQPQAKSNDNMPEAYKIPVSNDDGTVGNTIPNKVFAGGISWGTTEEGLRGYFTRFGEVVSVDLMRNRVDNQPRGFAFITFKDESSVRAATAKQMHDIDGKSVEVKFAFKKHEERDSTSMPTKLFVGGITPDTRESDLQEYFGQFGKLAAVVVMLDNQTQRGRGFGFVTYETKEDAEKVLRMGEHIIRGKHVDVKTYKTKPYGDRQRGMYGGGPSGGMGMPMGMGYPGHMGGPSGYGSRGYGGPGMYGGGSQGYGGGQGMYGGYGGYGGGMYGGGGYGHGAPHPGGYGGGYPQQRYGAGGYGTGQNNASEGHGSGYGGAQRQQQRDARYKPY